MPTALLVTADQGGNLPPMLGIGTALISRGWNVTVHGDAASVRAAEAAGLEAIAAEGIPYDAATPRTMLQALRDIPPFWADRTRGRDAAAAARRIGAQVVVVDGLLVGALAECENAGLPTVALVHTTWEGFRPFMTGPMGALMRLRGTRALPTLDRADLILITSDAALGVPVPLPANAVLTGPVLQEAPHRETRDGRPLVVVGLSTVAFPGQRAVLQRVLDAVATLPVDVLASTARSVEAEGLRVGGNTTLRQFVDHRAAFPEASVVRRPRRPRRNRPRHGPRCATAHPADAPDDGPATHRPRRGAGRRRSHPAEERGRRRDQDRGAATARRSNVRHHRRTTRPRLPRRRDSMRRRHRTTRRPHQQSPPGQPTELTPADNQEHSTTEGDC